MSLIRRLVTAVLLLAAPALMADIDQATEKRIVDGLKKWRPDLNYNNFAETPIPGLYHVQVIGGPALYVSGDGSYFIRGDLQEVKFGGTVNWRDTLYAPKRRDLIKAASVNDMVVFKPKAATKAVIYVFTDIDCGYCRKLHAEVPALNDMGVEVRYLAFPRAGLGTSSSKKLESVWCASDPVDAMNRMKQGLSVPAKSCETSAISDHLRLVREMGLNGTPAIILADGTLVSGYRRASEFKKILGL